MGRGGSVEDQPCSMYSKSLRLRFLECIGRMSRTVMMTSELLWLPTTAMVAVPTKPRCETPTLELYHFPVDSGAPSCCCSKGFFVARSSINLTQGRSG